MSYQINCND